MMPTHGMEVTRLTSGGLTDVFQRTANNCCEKSAEVIVFGSNESTNVNQKVGGLTIQRRTESCSWIVNECYLTRLTIVRCSI